MFRHPLVHGNGGSGGGAIAALPDRVPVEVASPARSNAKLRDAPKDLLELYQHALDDIAENVVEIEGQHYFGAGKVFGPVVFTRDIAYSGVLGLNRLWPDLMDASLRYTRRVRWSTGLRVSQGHDLTAMGIACEPLDCDEQAFMRRYRTNCYARRTDDVVWLWAAHDLYLRHPRIADWDWLLATGRAFFDRFYAPFRDGSTGLYRGQASFIDIHYGPGNPSSGYPPQWLPRDCLRIVSSSTNALYARGMDALADAASRLGDEAEAERWSQRAAALREAIRFHLVHADGRVSFYRRPDGTLEPRTEALSTCLCVLLGVFHTAGAARSALDALAVTPHGVPLIQPPLDGDRFYHNHSSWPFVEAFYSRARYALGDADALRRGIDRVAESCTPEGSFHEVADVRSGRWAGSTRQLWSASAFAGLCLDRYGPGK